MERIVLGQVRGGRKRRRRRGDGPGNGHAPTPATPTASARVVVQVAKARGWAHAHGGARGGRHGGEGLLLVGQVRPFLRGPVHIVLKVGGWVG